jgi:hypothetical protein
MTTLVLLVIVIFLESTNVTDLDMMMSSQIALTANYHIPATLMQCKKTNPWIEEVQGGIYPA